MPTSPAPSAPLSPAKLAANRANALRSTGPRTDAGKARSARNALTHGLSSPTPSPGIAIPGSPPAPSPLLPSEDPAQYDAFRDALLADLAPRTHEELELADRIVSLHWRLRRCPAVEAELARRHADAARRDHEYQRRTRTGVRGGKRNEPFAPPTAVQFLAAQFDARDDRSNPLARLHRYETGLDRTLRRCRADYRTLQLTRLATPAEPTPVGDPAAEAPDAPSPQEDALPNEPTAAPPTPPVPATDPPPPPHPEESPNEPTPTPPTRAASVSPALPHPHPQLPNEPTTPPSPMSHTDPTRSAPPI